MRRERVLKRVVFPEPLRKGGRKEKEGRFV
jgi:hypothetical protein